MSHTYKDEKTGVVFIYNSDLSGNITLRVPTSAKTFHTVEFPADALSRFVLHAMIDAEETLAWLDKMKNWLNQHTNAVAMYREGHASKPVFVGPEAEVCVAEHQYKFKVGDKVFLTFSEANGETGVITDVGFSHGKGNRYEYADVKLDKDGSRTGPMPVTCVKLRRPEDHGE